MQHRADHGTVRLRLLAAAPCVARVTWYADGYTDGYADGRVHLVRGTAEVDGVVALVQLREQVVYLDDGGRVVRLDADGAPRVDVVVGMEARGFILAPPVALALGAGFVPVRKAGKLPRETHAVSYDLEYGSATLELHRDAVAPGSRVLLVDDVLATGGTARATADLVEACGAQVVGVAVLMDLAFLPWRQALGAVEVTSLMSVD